MGLEQFDNYECDGQIEMVTPSYETCTTCRHVGYFPYSENYICCDYLADTGRSRIFDWDGKRICPKGMCVTYEMNDKTRGELGKEKSKEAIGKFFE